jgi:hypothetical protein
MEEREILVIYVGVANVQPEDISDFCHRVAKKIIPTSFIGEVILLPVQSLDTRIECINPKYITDEELVKEHTNLMKELNEALHFQLEILKENKNE